MKVSGYATFVTANEKNMPFYIASIGNPKYQTIVHRPLGISDYQLLYTAAGKGECFLNGQTYALKPDSLYYLPPGVPHEYAVTGDLWETFYITFNGSGTAGFFDFEPTIWQLDKAFVFEDWYQALYTLKWQPENSRRLSAVLYAMLLEIKEYCIQAATATARKKEHVMIQAMHDMAENAVCSLSEIAENAGVSEAYFCRTFKAYTGFRPFEYLNRLKIQKAKELLCSSALPIGEIAGEVGYESHSYFSMLFKRYVGVTPAEYRGRR